ncbi:MAG: alpha/beta hydrolase [Chloroflexi bacterium]|nr:alpha/beta hydrolase [Chloroflexota bacterium]
MAFVTVLDHTIYYECEGAGPAVVLLHHATASHENWRPQIDALVAAGYTTLAYDREGFGRSQPLPRWSATYHQEGVDELVALLDVLGWERVALVGHSDGATISLIAAAQHPRRIAAVVAEAPHMWIEPAWLDRGFEAFRTTVGASPRFWRAMRRYHGEQAEQVVQRWRDRWLDPSFHSWDMGDCLPQVQCPVLVIHGKEDIFFPISHSQSIAERLPQSHFLLLEKVGHTPHLENTTTYNQHLLSFLSRYWPPETS